MTDKELKKLKRADLIEILYYLKKDNEDLTKENEELRSRLDALVSEAISSKHNNIAEEITVPDPQQTTEDDLL